MKVRRLDTIYLTVTNLNRSIRFYHEVFDLPILKTPDDSPRVLNLGNQHIILKEVTKDFIQRNEFRLIVGDNFEDILNHLKNYFIDIIDTNQNKVAGLLSVKISDPDGNIIHIATQSNR